MTVGRRTGYIFQQMTLNINRENLVINYAFISVRRLRKADLNAANSGREFLPDACRAYLFL